MYLQRLGLRTLPFRLTPDAAFYYPARGHTAPRAVLREALSNRGGLTALIGPSGTGKTLLLQRLRQDLPTDLSTAHFNQSPATTSDWVHGLLVQFGHRVMLTGAALGDALTTILQSREAVEQRTVISIDNGHRCSRPVLAALVEHISAFPHVTVVLVGEPALQPLLDTATAGRACAPRIGIVESLHADEVDPYLQHRLDVAGAGGRRVFQSAAADMLMRVTDGVPKQINRYADGAISAAFDAMRDTVLVEDVLSAARLLGSIDAAHERQRAAPLAAVSVTPPIDSAMPPDATDDPAAPEDPFDAVVASGIESAHANWHAAVVADLDLIDTDRPTTVIDVSADGLTDAEDIRPITPSGEVYRLHLQHGGVLERTIELGEGVLTIGRSSENALQISSRYVSRLHCTITRDGPHLSIEDLDSTNGVYLRGEPIWREPLQPGDVVQIGMHELRVERVDAPR